MGAISPLGVDRHQTFAAALTVIAPSRAAAREIAKWLPHVVVALPPPIRSNCSTANTPRSTIAKFALLAAHEAMSRSGAAGRCTASAFTPLVSVAHKPSIRFQPPPHDSSPTRAQPHRDASAVGAAHDGQCAGCTGIDALWPEMARAIPIRSLAHRRQWRWRGVPRDSRRLSRRRSGARHRSDADARSADGMECAAG